METSLEELRKTFSTEDFLSLDSAQLSRLFPFSASLVAGDSRVIQIDEQESLAGLNSLIDTWTSALPDRASTSCFVLALANHLLIRRGLDIIISKAESADPLQSTVFELMAVEGDCEALSALLIDLVETSGAEAASVRERTAHRAAAAFIASLQLLSSFSTVLQNITATESDWGSIGSELHKSMLSLTAVNRRLGDAGALPAHAVESLMNELGVVHI